MDFKLNEKSRGLLERLMQIPPDFQGAEQWIRTEALSADEVTRAAIVYADESTWDVENHWTSLGYTDNAEPPLPTAVIPGLNSTHLLDVMRFLFPFGMDPNRIYDDYPYNLMSTILWVDNEYVAADTLRYIFEHGGDPNLMVDGRSLYDDIAEDIGFGEVEQYARWRYDSWVHTWFVVLGYGGRPKDRELSLTLFKEWQKETVFSLEKLREHRNYSVTLLRDGDIAIYDKNTFWEVARW